MKRIAVITFLTCSVLQSFSQAKESTILKAMQDELDRNMKELKYGDFEKPFFISYTLTDVYQFEVAASMGSLLRSVKTPLKNHNVRVLVGDYAFNDESLDGNSSFQGAEANEVPLPVDDDYYGIRRSFWAMTDYVYKGAARQFKQNQQSVKEKKKNLDEIPHRHFAKLPPVQIRETAIPYAFDARSMEKLVASVSAEFLNYTDLENSSVFLSFQDGYKYLVNSEGTSAIYPEQTFTLYAVASLRTEQGEQLSETLMFSGFTPADLPAATAIMAEIKMLYDRLKGRADLPTLEDDYTGPVLFAGNMIPEILSSGLTERDLIIASDALPNPKARYAEENTQESKLNKPVTHESITVKAKTKMRTYKGTPLLGSYPIDEDGVVPPDELLLIENGVLKNLLNDRNLIRSFESANGHRSGIGVIEITSSNASSIDALKKKLIEKGKSDGLKFVMMVHANGTGYGNAKIYTKIDVNNGKEEVVRNVSVERIAQKQLRQLIGCSNELKAYNESMRGGNRISFIAPEAMVLNNVEIRKTNIPFYKEEEHVPNPLKKTVVK